MVGRVVVAAMSICCLSALVGNPLRGQERALSLVLKGNLTTSSQIFPNPNAANATARAQSISLQDLFGYGVELKYQIPETNIAFGISADYIHTTRGRSILAFPQQLVPVDDGYRVIPVECTGYFLIPASGPTFGIFMGGGGGVYFGRRIYRLAGTEAASVDERPGFGIHVLGGVSYRFTERFTLIAEMKFRDLQFESSNAFSTSRIHYRDIVVNVSQTPFDSSIHTDGIVFQLGAAFSF